MVTPTAFREGSRLDRAQLVLVGSIAIALVIIGLVVVINTVLFTENVATSESVGQSDDAAKFDYQARRDTRSLLLRVNHDEHRIDETTLKANIAENVTLYSHLLLDSYADGTNVWVNVTYRNGSSSFGQRLVKEDDQEFTAPDGSRNWAIVPTNADVDVGRFVANLNVSETRTTSFSINVSNATEYTNYTVKAEDPGANSEVAVNVVTRAGSTTVECDPSAGRVLIDFRAGDSFTSDCVFPGFDPIEPPYNVTVINGTNGFGKFGLVANESITEYQVEPYGGGSFKSYDTCVSSPAQTCQTPAIWDANLTFRYESRTINYTQRRNLSVYP